MGIPAVKPKNKTGGARMRKFNIKNLSAVFIFSLLLFQYYGCGSNFKKKAVTETTFSCDPEADRALKEMEFEKSIRLHMDFIEKNPENGLPYYHMGYIYSRLGDHEREIDYYRKAVERGYLKSGILFNLGMAYGEVGKFDECIRTFKQAIDLEPGKQDNHFGLALAYRKMSRNKEAENEFKKVIEINPENTEAMYLLGELYLDTGEKKKAENQLESILKVDPESEAALDLKNMLLRYK